MSKIPDKVDIGRARAESAARALRRWTGVRALAVCVLKPAYGYDSKKADVWIPVGELSFKEIARDDGYFGSGNYHLLIVDETGTAKASTWDRYPLEKVLQLAKRLPLPIAAPGTGELWMQLNNSCNPSSAPENAQRIDV